MFVNTDPVVVLYETFKIYISPLSVIGTLLLMAWKIRGFVDTLINNHLTHIKQDIVEAVKSNEETLEKIIKTENEGHEGVIDALRKMYEKSQDNHEKLIEAVQKSSDRIVDTLISLNKK
jgi:predicted PurR-regulated permease PerM